MKKYLHLCPQSKNSGTLASIPTLLFWFFAVLGISGALGLLFNRDPVYAALSLIVNFFSIAGLYLSLQAEFLAVIQITVYAGAIMVLFLFVIMLLNLDQEQNVTKFDWRRGAAFILGLGFVGEMLFVLRGFGNSGPITGPYSYGTTEAIGQALMTTYLFPFEIISVVLLIALVGAILIARKYKPEA